MINREDMKGISEQTIEEMHKDFEENPEQKKVVEEQLMYFFPKWIEQKFKEKTINSLLEEDKKFIFQCLLLGGITKNEIDQSLQSEGFGEIVKLLNELTNGDDKIIEQLHEIYRNNVIKTKTEYEQKILDFKYACLPKTKREQVNKLRDKGENNKANTIINAHRKYDEKVQKVESGYNTFCGLVDVFDVCQFNAKAIEKNKDLIPKLAFAINSPDFLMPTYVDIILNREEEFPSSWYLYHKLTVAEYKTLFSQDNKQQKWNYLLNMVGNSILDKAETPILPIMKRKELLNSIMTNFQNKQWDSAMIIAFSVIEGLLWELSLEVNKKEKVFTNNHSGMYDCEKGEEFKSTRIRDVLERTSVKNYLDQEFIREFCEEVYEERNPVLHGNWVCRYRCKNQGVCFIKKLFVLDYLLNTIEEIYQKHLFDILDNSFDSNKVNEFIGLFYGKGENA